jgi:hypothetical protein
MHFNLYRHVRVAGSIVTLIGFWLPSNILFWGGVFVTTASYIVSMNAIEHFLERATKEHETKE